MAGKVLDYVLEWVDDNGREVSRSLPISFASNYITREYNVILDEARKVQKAWDKISDITSEINALKIRRPDGYKDRLAELDEAANKEKEIIERIGSGDIIARRFELVKELLIKNGVKEDDEILDADFWDKSVDATVMWDLLTQAVHKDVVKKK